MIINKYKVAILPNNLEILVDENTSLKEIFTENGVNFEFPCGGMGVCKQCKVKIIKKNGQEIERLACRYKVKEDLTVEIPVVEQKHEILAEGLERDVLLAPLIKKIYLEIPPPSLKDTRDDWNRIVGKKGIRTNLKVLQDLPEQIRKSDFKATVVIEGDKVRAIESQDTSEKLLGMAFDIGTTTIAGYLINLKTGEEITQVSSLNPQTKYGADVISRISFASKSGGLEKLHREIIDELNKLIENAVKKVDYKQSDVYVITIAGNTTMQHLFLKIQPKYLALAPYVPVTTEQVIVDADELKIKINPAGKVFVFPNIAGFVGGDTVAAALTCEMDKTEKLKLLIDIGTNGEIVLGTKDRLLACATAAGPAFEGVQISCGMRGASGAIDHVSMGEDYKYTVIGNAMPRGVAGSGLVDAVAELLKIGLVNKNGRIVKQKDIKDDLGKKHSNRIEKINGISSFVLAKNTATGQPVYINQKDIREFQLAKGAISAGIEILVKEYGAKVDDIDEVFLAGAFGNYLNRESACKVGLIPKELEEKTKGIGNAAGVGAKLALLSEKEYERAVMLSHKIQYIELSAHPEFNSTFFTKLDF